MSGSRRSRPGVGPHEAGGCVELISTGTSPLDSSLLGVSADGTDAYFFTRDTLVASDNNGSRVKIYDARAGGGFDQAPPPHQCQASDECHGAEQPGAAAARHQDDRRHRRWQRDDKPPQVQEGLSRKHGKCVRSTTRPPPQASHRTHRRRRPRR